MGSKAPSDHFVDIQQEGPPERQAVSGPILKPAGHRGRARNINRQVSLETGFAVLNMPNAGSSSRERKAALPRSGKSLGGANYSGGDVAAFRKGDFNMFRTKSTLIKQNSLMPQRKEGELDANNNHGGEGHASGGGGSSTGEGVKDVPAGRYFAALRGPELDQVKESEDILLPKDQLWPFLLRFPINCFGICLGLGSQAILWRNLSTSPSTAFLHVSPSINLTIWLLALAVLLSVSAAYALKCAFYFEAVRREFFHPIRINFFFAPWIACMFLAIGVPRAFSTNAAALHPSLWLVFVVPLFLLELKIYGQWLSGGKRRLCKVANPSSHLSVVGNFVGAILAANCGWREAGKFLWAVGLAHYLVVFVTLYQRLPTNEALPKELHPVYSMFIATPSAASIAWKAIYGDFDAVARTFYFIALFLFTSLVVRINFFRGFKFSVAWWSYTFPMTTVSLATIKYAEEVPCFFTKGLALSLTVVSSTIVSLLFVSTLLHAFVWRSLFPNDLAIAITRRKATHGAGTQAKEKRPARKSYDIKRWAKQNIVTAIAKSSSAEKDT